MQDEMQNIILKLQEISSNLHQDMQKISIQLPLETEKRNEYINKMTEGDLTQCLKRFTFTCIPKRSNVEIQVRHLAKANPIIYNIPITITDPIGRPIAIVKGLNEDFDSHVYLHAGKEIILMSELGVSRQILEIIFKKNKVNVNKLLNYIYKSPLFSQDRKEIFKAGLQSYLKKKPIEAMHVLIPQIEDALRNLLGLKQQPVYKQNQHGGYNLRILDDILRDKAVIDVLGVDIVFYFRVLFTDQCGLCLRHNACHGLSSSDSFNIFRADLIFHALLILSEVRIESQD